VNFFSAFNASCWPLGGGFYSRIEPDFHLLAQLMRLPIRLSLCLLPVSKLTNGGIERFVFSHPVALTARPGRRRA